MVEAARTGWRASPTPLTERRRTLCAFAEKLTRTPSAMREDDVASLRAAGLEDQDILEVVHIVGYFNYINRVAEALAVDPEDFMLPEA